MRNSETFAVVSAVLIVLLTLLSFIQMINTNHLSRQVNLLQERLDRKNMEYQMVVCDDSLTVFDANRVVGTVKLQGQLDSLIIEDNQ